MSNTNFNSVHPSSETAPASNGGSRESENSHENSVLSKFGLDTDDDSYMESEREEIAEKDKQESKEEIIESIRPSDKQSGPSDSFDLYSASNDEILAHLGLPPRDSYINSSDDPKAVKGREYDAIFQQKLIQADTDYWNGRLAKNNADAKVYKKTKPDLDDALVWLTNGYKKEVIAQGYTEQEANYYVLETLKQIDSNAKAKKQITPEFAYNLAVSRGYKSKLRPPPKRSLTAENQKLMELLNASDEEFDSKATEILRSTPMNVRRSYRG